MAVVHTEEDTIRAYVFSVARSRVSRGLELEDPIWTWFLALGAMSRALSYGLRPPTIVTPASHRIEGILPYPVWSVILIGVVLLLVVGTMRHAPVLTWLGHVVGASVTIVFAVSVFSSAVVDDQPWSGVWPMVVVALVHAGRANHLGDQVRASSVAARLTRGRSRE